MSYDATYYQSGNYTNYLERGPRYEQIARELDALFTTLRLNGHILDYGCGVGFLVRALRALGRDVAGCDTSGWAQVNAVVPVASVHHPAFIMLALDVFEHMDDAAIGSVCRAVNPAVLIARIPCAEQTGASFHLACSRADSTHTNCKSRAAWQELLYGFGFSVVLRLNLHTIYDSPGVACFLALKPTTL